MLENALYEVARLCARERLSLSLVPHRSGMWIALLSAGAEEAEARLVQGRGQSIEGAAADAVRRWEE